jgi:hypothetical protein
MTKEEGQRGQGKEKKIRGIGLTGFVSRHTYEEVVVPFDGSWGQNLQTGRVT